MTSKRTIGTCSLCGGPVTVPTIWWSVVPPIPHCERCGAVPKQAFGPVIDMERRSPSRHRHLSGNGVHVVAERFGRTDG